MLDEFLLSLHPCQSLAPDLDSEPLALDPVHHETEHHGSLELDALGLFPSALPL